MAIPDPNIVNVRPVTFWLALNVMVRKLYISPANADAAKQDTSAIITHNALLGSATWLSYINTLASEAMAPMYIIPGTPRLRLPAFSDIISPIHPNIITVPNTTAA